MDRRRLHGFGYLLTKSIARESDLSHSRRSEMKRRVICSFKHRYHPSQLLGRHGCSCSSSAWYSWRHQIPVLAAAGFHAVAPDLRGYGDRDSPSDVQAYTAFHSVGDIIGLLDALGQEKAFVVGHDYGALLAWYVSILRPDRVKAVAALCVPAIIQNREGSLVEKLDQVYGKRFYISRFQEPGRAEAEFARP
ncbi:hypothetical protein O6H91_14G010400 [Diphasiastrum complanatum]|uniref:Uncharacterized protein n=1 Tax=Diphasiastrum complanatum TaxID=34168 RepID=A0ACC2BLH0_DIPCM|nr:hypothetical protein O6H91_14G010400 [Diphasiastrum complanatum]